MKNVKMKVIAVACLSLFIAAHGVATLWISKKLTNNIGHSEYPTIAVNGSDIYAFWFDGTPGNYEIFFRKSADSGSSWQASKRLTYTSGSSWYPAIAVNGAKIYVAWQDDTVGNDEIYFKRTLDGGATWQDNQRLTNTSGNSEEPAIAVNGANVYVVWHDDTSGTRDIFFRKSADGGATWQTAIPLRNNTEWSADPAIAVNGATVYVVWDETISAGQGEIFFRRSTDGGATWQSVKRLTNTTGGSWCPDIALSSTSVYLVWYDFTPGNAEIYFRKSADGGATWQTAQRLTNTAGDSYFPAITVNGSDIYLSWTDYYSWANSEIYFKSSANGGAGWQSTQRLTYTSGDSDVPDVAVNDTTIFVIYADYTPGNGEIFLKHHPIL